MRLLGHPRGVNIEWLIKKFDDLELAGLEVSTASYTVRTSVVRKHAWTADKQHYAVVLESEYISFFGRDMRVHSEGLTDAIIALRSAPVKALVRFVISHRSWHRSMDETLDKLCYAGGERSRRRAKAEIRNRAESLLLGMAITIKGNMVHYEQKQNGLVWFEPPATSAISSRAEPLADVS
jgi:hypothetical protein